MFGRTISEPAEKKRAGRCRAERRTAWGAAGTAARQVGCLFGGGCERAVLGEQGRDLGAAGGAAASGAGGADDVAHGLGAIASELQDGLVSDSGAVTHDHCSRSSEKRLPEFMAT